MKLTLDIENEVELLDKYKLTCNELMFIRVTLIFQDESNEELFKNYFKAIKNTGINVRELLVSLQQKGVILKSYKIPAEGTALNPMTIEFNKNFLKQLYRSSFEMGKELFEAYPQFATLSNGSVVTLRGVSKHFNSLEDAYYRYGKCIKYNNDLHKEIIDLVNWGKDNNIICQSMSSFIINNNWHDLKALRDGDKGYNYNAVKML